ncbi:hypothetical protein [Deinococcus sp. UR1]|uniref:hypothetical protein n=1 Tax=Deinococcus sp. UR1 TaxID=1704277 RepID=UPI0018ECE5FF|nr:hypothetical protein [Deinococcus sp. UR1]
MSHVMLTHPTDPKLTGPVVFRLPDMYTSIAIQRRVTELANAGRNPKLAVLHPMDLPPEGYQMCVMVATLEHVIVSAPEGLYRTQGGRAVLMPGALSEFEGEEVDGAVSVLYAAYNEWRLRFRQRRAGPTQSADEAGQRQGDSAGGETGGTRPAASAGSAAGTPDDNGSRAADS